MYMRRSMGQLTAGYTLFFLIKYNGKWNVCMCIYGHGFPVGFWPRVGAILEGVRSSYIERDRMEWRRKGGSAGEQIACDGTISSMHLESCSARKITLSKVFNRPLKLVIKGIIRMLAGIDCSFCADEADPKAKIDCIFSETNLGIRQAACTSLGALSDFIEDLSWFFYKRWRLAVSSPNCPSDYNLCC